MRRPFSFPIPQVPDPELRLFLSSRSAIRLGFHHFKPSQVSDPALIKNLLQSAVATSYRIEQPEQVLNALFCMCAATLRQFYWFPNHSRAECVQFCSSKAFFAGAYFGQDSQFPTENSVPSDLATLPWLDMIGVLSQLLETIFFQYLQLPDAEIRKEGVLDRVNPAASRLSTGLGVISASFEGDDGKTASRAFLEGSPVGTNQAAVYTNGFYYGSTPFVCASVSPVLQFSSAPRIRSFKEFMTEQNKLRELRPATKWSLRKVERKQIMSETFSSSKQSKKKEKLAEELKKKKKLTTIAS